MKKMIMVTAWTIARKAQSIHGGKVREYFAESLKLAWQHAKAETAETVENVSRETMPKKKATKKASVKKVETVETVEPIDHQDIPANIRSTFGNAIAETVNEMIERFVKQANKTYGEHLVNKRFVYEDGMNALSNAETFIELQAAMTTYFLRDYITYASKKHMQLGIGYKLKRRKDKDFDGSKAMLIDGVSHYDYDKDMEAFHTWQNSSSSAGNITQYEADELAHEVIALSYEQVLSEQMFDDVRNVYTTIFYRISNAIQKMMNQLRRETRVRTKNGEYAQMPKSTIDDAIWLIDEYGITGDEEKEVLKLHLQGFRKKEIDAIMGKRTDRTFGRLKKNETMLKLKKQHAL